MKYTLFYAFLFSLLFTACNFEKKPAHVPAESITTPESKSIEELPTDSLNVAPSNINIPTYSPEELQGINFLKAKIGKYPTQEHIFSNETLKSRLKNMPNFPFENMVAFWNTETPLVMENNIVHSSGCKDNDCPSNAFELFIDLENDNINVYHFRDNTLRIYQENGLIELPKIFNDEIKIKKNNANIGDIHTTESNYKITPQSYAPQNSDDAIAEKIAAYLTNDLLKSDINVMSDDQREFQYESIDLNDDGVDEYFIGFQNSYFCGSGGCTYYLIGNNGKLITKFTVSQAPFMVLENNSNGWKNLVVESNGNLRLLTFNGTTYPSNPSLAPAYKETPGTNTRSVLSHKNPIPNYEF